MRFHLASWASGLLAAPLTLSCGLADADDKGTRACEDVRAECAIGGKFELVSDAAEQCGVNGQYKPTDGEIAAGGACDTKGSCNYACTYDLQAVNALCDCGVKRYSIKEGIECKDCDGTADDDETDATQQRPDDATDTDDESNDISTDNESTDDEPTDNESTDDEPTGEVG